MENIFIRSGIIWFLFIPIAILNGLIREKGYKPLVGDLMAHQISTVTASVAFIALSFLLMKNKFVVMEVWQLFLIGFMWVIMTILFEFGFGHYIAKHSWSTLFADYNIMQGRVWGIFLLVILLTPFSINLFLNTK